MREFQQVFWGVLIALLSVGIILGSLSVALIEGGMSAVLETTPTRFVRLVTQPIPSILPPVSNASTETVVVLLITTQSSTNTPQKLVHTATPRCPLPRDWIVYVIQPGDSLASIADKFGTTEEMLADANCLKVNMLFVGTELYVPNVYPTTVVEQCGPPAKWVFYTVKPKDTLYRLSRLFGVTVAQLQYANCLGSSTLIRAGQRLFVPNVSTSTPRVVPSDTPQPTDTATSTPSATVMVTITPPHMPTSTPTATMPPTSNPTRTPTPTSTPTDLPTATNTPTELPTVTATQTLSPTATSTQTLLPTSTTTELPPTQILTATQTPVPPTATVTVNPTNP